MNPFGFFETPAMAQQRMMYQLQIQQNMIYQLQVEQWQFWYPINARPPMSDFERQQAVVLLGQRLDRLAMLRATAMAQGFGQLVFLVDQETSSVVNAQRIFLSFMQGPLYPLNPGYQAPAPPAYPAPSAPVYPPRNTPTPRFSGPDDLQNWLAKSSDDQQRFRDILLGDCIHCHKPLEGQSKCPHCRSYQNP
jgi:hypothetical protein